LVLTAVSLPAEAKAFSDTLTAETTPAPFGLDADPTDYTDRDLLYAEFAPLVRGLIRQYGQNAEMREDLAGEIYCRFCALLDVFDPARGVPLRAYIVRQLTLATYTYARQQWRIQKREATWEIEEARAEQRVAFDPTADWLAALAHSHALSLLPAAMNKLPARQRNVIFWRYFEERSFEEIAGIISVQPTTARSLLRHGLNNLRKLIGSADCF
jgi:RNA polymerase sigma-70 factor (ECF subfamily)